MLSQDPENSEKLKAIVDSIVSYIRIDNLPDDITISCSVGCTEITDEDTVESLVARADEALYEAKQAGRNCVRTL